MSPCPYCYKPCPWCFRTSGRDPRGTYSLISFIGLTKHKKKGGASRVHGVLWSRVCKIPRWLSLEQCVQRTLEKYTGLKSYLKFCWGQIWEDPPCLWKSTYQFCSFIMPLFHCSLIKFNKLLQSDALRCRIGLAVNNLNAILCYFY